MTTAAETMPPGVGPDEADLRQGRFPPVARLGTLTLAMTVAGGVLMAAEYGKPLRFLPRSPWPQLPAPC